VQVGPPWVTRLSNWDWERAYQEYLSITLWGKNMRGKIVATHKLAVYPEYPLIHVNEITGKPATYGMQDKNQYFIIV